MKFIREVGQLVLAVVLLLVLLVLAVVVQVAWPVLSRLLGASTEARERRIR
jgi:hypothetical protein